MSTAIPIIRQAGEGERMWFAGGGVFTWKATAGETGGSFSAFEDRMERGKTTPLHLHPDMDEAIYVLDGEIRVHAEGEERTLGAGGLFVAPRGLPHAFLVTSETAHILAILIPGSADAFYRAAGAPITSEADEARPADFGLLQQVAEQSPSIELLGPPPFAAVGAAAQSSRS